MKTVSVKIYFYLIICCFLLLAFFDGKNFAQEKLSLSTVQIQKCWENHLEANGSDNNFEPFFTKKTEKYEVEEDFDFLFFFEDGFLKSFDYKTGKEKWRVDTGGELAVKPFIQGNGVFIVTKPLLKNSATSTGKLPHSIKFINKETGVADWSKTFFNEGSLYLYGFKDITILINQRGKTTAFKQQNGSILWENSYSDTLSSPPFFFGDKVIFPEDKGFVVVSLSDGKTIFQEKDDYSKLKSLTANEKTLFLGDERGSIKVFDIGSKERKWSYRLGGAVSSVTYRKGFILAASLDNFIYYFSANDGKLIWKKRAAGRLIAEPLVFDQFVLILAEGSTNALILDLSDGKIVNRLSFPDETYLVENPKKINEIFVLRTKKGIIAYSLGQCP